MSSKGSWCELSNQNIPDGKKWTIKRIKRFRCPACKQLFYPKNIFKKDEGGVVVFPPHKKKLVRSRFPSRNQ